MISIQFQDPGHFWAALRFVEAQGIAVGGQYPLDASDGLTTAGTHRLLIPDDAVGPRVLAFLAAHPTFAHTIEDAANLPVLFTPPPPAPAPKFSGPTVHPA